MMKDLNIEEFIFQRYEDWLIFGCPTPPHPISSISMTGVCAFSLALEIARRTMRKTFLVQTNEMKTQTP